jgi:hypothetical protein
VKIKLLVCGLVMVVTALWTGAPGVASSPADDQKPTSSQSSQQSQGQQSQGAQLQGGRGDQSRQPSRPRLPYWKDPAIIKEIGLTQDQARQIDKLWEDRAKEMMGRSDDLKKQDDELKRLIAERKVGADVIALQIDRVEAQRTLLSKSRTVMLYRMSLVLSAEQHKKLQAIYERNRRGGGSDHR